MPMIYAGQGVHYAKAWPELLQVAELLEAPVGTSMEGKSAFPETHALSLGAGGNTMSRALATHVRDIGRRLWRRRQLQPGLLHPMADGEQALHPRHRRRARSQQDHSDRFPGARRRQARRWRCCTRRSASGCAASRAASRAQVAARIQEQNGPWIEAWRPFMTSNDKPLSPYRVLHDLLQTADVANTIITHDAGSPRDEMIPFWKTVTPLSYIGWGKTTQLGYGLGLAMGAKVAQPDKLCINWWGEAAIGMTGMDFETCVRCQIPIMSILSNNFGMKTEYAAMKVSHAKYRTCDISGNYADFAKAMGGYGERVTEPEQVVHAIVNGIRATKEGKPVLLEFITTQDVKIASGGAMPAASDPSGGGVGRQKAEGIRLRSPERSPSELRRDGAPRQHSAEAARRQKAEGKKGRRQEHTHVSVQEASRSADVPARHGRDGGAASARRDVASARAAGLDHATAASRVRLLPARRGHERVDSVRQPASGRPARFSSVEYSNRYHHSRIG